MLKRITVAAAVTILIAGCANNYDQLNRRDAQQYASFEAEAQPILSGIDSGTVDIVSGTAQLADIASRTMPDDPAYQAAWKRASRIAEGYQSGQLAEADAKQQIASTLQAYQTFKDQQYQTARQKDFETQNFLNAMAAGIARGASNYTYQQNQMYQQYQAAPVYIPQPVNCTTRAPYYAGGSYQTTCN